MYCLKCHEECDEQESCAECLADLCEYCGQRLQGDLYCEACFLNLALCGTCGGRLYENNIDECAECGHLLCEHCRRDALGDAGGEGPGFCPVCAGNTKLPAVQAELDRRWAAKRKLWDNAMRREARR